MDRSLEDVLDAEERLFTTVVTIKSMAIVVVPRDRNQNEMRL